MSAPAMTASVPRNQMGGDEFRAALRAFLQEHHPGKRPRDADEALAWQKAWNATLVDHGWGGASWPVEHGGMDLPFELQVVFHEEIGRAKVPGALGTGTHIAAPTIVRYGTDEQRERWLRPMLRGDEIWVQGFSEPDAGSDLPSLRTRAVLDGDHYVVNGAKVWSSAAEIGTMIFALVRTGTQESRDKGITYLVVDVDSPGLTLSPIRDMTGGAHFAEWIFEDVAVPVVNRIGDEDGGWPIARTSLGHERAANALSGATMYRRVVRELIELARERGLTSDPIVRQRLMWAETEVRLAYLGGVRQIQNIVRDGEPGPISSVSRLGFGLFEQRLHELAVDLLGASGMLAQRDPDAVQRGRWVWGFLRTRGSTIGAGTTEIQRNTAAERVLGLPRDPVPS
ncbi:MAG: acyl-CoA dehydrogenase family protein [Ilumatobacteraceae bacterium]